MNNRCPACGEKLSPFYLKQTCPKCNANLLYYDFENSLEKDHINALKEQRAVENFLYKLRLSSIGCPISILRLISLILPLLFAFLPLAQIGNDKISGFWLIKGLVNKTLSFDTIFADKCLMLLTIGIFSVALFFIINLISSLFSMSKAAIIRNTIFTSLGLIAFTVLLVFATKNNGSVQFGSVLIILSYVIQGILHTLVYNKIHKIYLEKK